MLKILTVTVLWLTFTAYAAGGEISPAHGQVHAITTWCAQPDTNYKFNLSN